MGSTSDLWQQFESAFERESDLRVTLRWDRKLFVNVNAGKAQLILFYRSSNSSAVDVKTDGCVLDKKSYFKMLGSVRCFSSNL